MRHPLMAAALAGLCVIVRPAAAEEPRPSAAPASERQNHAPKFAETQVLEWATGTHSARDALHLRVGRPVQMRLEASDPEEDPLSYSAISLPAGATFDPAAGLFTWQPKSAQQTHVRFRVSDGRLSDTLNLSVGVRNNAPPGAEPARVFVFEAGSARTRSEGTELAQDLDGDALTVRVEQAPRGASVVALGNRAVLHFAPEAGQLGEYPLVFEASDGERSTRVAHTLLVMPKWNQKDWAGALLPGGGPSVFVTHGNGDAFLGGAFDVTIRAVRGDGPTGRLCEKGEYSGSCYASHRRFYAEFEVLDALRAGVSPLFTYGFGFSSTFEWYPARRALIPFYSAEVGGLVQGEFGHLAQTRAALGLHLWASDGAWLSTALGYRVVPAGLYDLSGPTLSLRAVLNPW